jgi:glycosyltransferase involved in cell wall biosynthesis
MSTTDTLPLVTVLVPCRNEAQFIERCLTSIIDNGYPEDRLQVLVIDGQSTDGTREFVDQFTRAHRCVLRLDNPRCITPVALNIGISEAKGAFILWMSGHNEYDKDYISACVEWSIRTGADNVGGIIITEPRERTFFGRASTAALTHPFGVGGSKFRTIPAGPVWTDTVFGGCYRREVFETIGLFNEHLARGQDFELNMRLRKAGMRTLLVPTIRSTYYARSKPGEFLKHNWTNGQWAILPFRYTEAIPISLRHLVPMVFAGGLLGTILIAVVIPAFRWAPVLILVPYLVAALSASVDVGVRKKSIALGLAMPIVFLSLHLSYGLGSMWAAARTLRPLARHAARTLAPLRALRKRDDLARAG